MFVINPLIYLLQLDCILYIFGVFAFFGLILLLKKIFGRGV